MKIAVTGGAGYLGSTLATLLLERGYEVAVLDRLLHGIQPILPLLRHPRFTFARGDIRDKSWLAQQTRAADAIIHLAAIVGYPACARSPQEAETTNVEGTRNLSAAVGRGRPVIFASTSSCYGAVDQGVCTEDTPLRPLSLYGQTKARAEAILLEACDAVVYRLATAYGLSPRLRLDLLVNDFVYRAVHDRRLVVYQPHFRRSFIHVEDAARAIVLAIEQSSSIAGQVFNVGDESQNHTKLEVCQIIEELIPGTQIETSTKGCDADHRNYVVSYGRIKSLGYQTGLNIRDGVQELLKVVPWIDQEDSFANVASSQPGRRPANA